MYFILSAVGFYILTVGLNLISDSEITMATGYSMLLVPSILLIFYPTCFGIQNDQDAKIIEIIFGIPNYRYKIWLFRLLIAYMICFIITLLLAAVTDWLVVEVPPLQLASRRTVAPLFIIPHSLLFLKRNYFFRRFRKKFCIIAAQSSSKIPVSTSTR